MWQYFREEIVEQMGWAGTILVFLALLALALSLGAVPELNPTYFSDRVLAGLVLLAALILLSLCRDRN